MSFRIHSKQSEISQEVPRDKNPKIAPYIDLEEELKIREIKKLPPQPISEFKDCIVYDPILKKWKIVKKLEKSI